MRRWNPTYWVQGLKQLKSKALIMGAFTVSFLFLLALAFLCRPLLENNVKSAILERITNIEQRYGVSIDIGRITVGFGEIQLDRVSIGRQPWLELHNVVIGLSMNPFQEFLRPNELEVSEAQLHLPRDKELWPEELKNLLAVLSNPGRQEKKGSRSGLQAVLLPRKISLRMDQLLWFDKEVAVLDLKDAVMSVNLLEKRSALRIHELVAFDRIKEKFLELELRLSDRSEVQINLRQRPEFKNRPLWSASCQILGNPLSGRCDLDADRLPKMFISYFQSRLGEAFAPGFRGVLGVETIDGVTLKKLRLSVHGVWENIFIQHPSLALDAVGPVNVRSNIDIDIDRELSLISAGKSDLFVFSPEETGGLGIPFAIEFSLNYKSIFEKFWLPTGNLQLNAENIDCSAILRTTPDNFAPELVGFEMTGDAALRTQVSLDQSDSKISIAGSRFGCQVTAMPEMYSAAYLMSPFVIERQTPSGKITIPVDPSRPYFMSYKDIPPLVRTAFVSSEDTGFFSHHGVEIGAIIGAVERNAEEGRAAVGGSTITMQTVKNLFLARDKTLSRKLQEIFLAWHLEKIISKERILEIYLNMVEFGPGLYGIGRASQRFFSKNPVDLSLKEAIYMASLLPAPIPRYRYFCKGELSPNYNAIIRQLLDRMLMLRKITPTQHAQALTEKIEFSKIERDFACSPDSSSVESREVISPSNDD